MIFWLGEFGVCDENFKYRRLRSFLILLRLGDLPAEEEYEDLTLDAFMSKF